MTLAETLPLEERVWLVGELAPEERDATGPTPASAPRPTWSREEYRAQMLRLGITETRDESVLGMDGYIALAGACGILEKRPTIGWVIDADGVCRPSGSGAA
ncbi:hypothetical protein [Nonomuraea sp. NPDC046570]|uniref:hypothetical protein n=1 Tax=Nonomuraea sp. NPDC046570 TaxID=3155255 RepID=UPI0033F3485A